MEGKDPSGDVYALKSPKLESYVDGDRSIGNVGEENTTERTLFLKIFATSTVGYIPPPGRQC
jgi:hypothetical protein